MTRRPRVYVSGPMAGAPGSNYLANLRYGIDCGRRLMALGCVPFVPHNSALTGLVYPDIPHEEWLALDLSWVEACDALIRIPGASSGADQEVAHARHKWPIPVFFMSKADDDPGRANLEPRGTVQPQRFRDWLKSWRP